MATTTSPPGRRLVRAFVSEAEPGMRKLIVGMLTAEAWSEPAASDAAVPAATSTTGDPHTEGADTEALLTRPTLRWTADIDLADPK